MLLQHEPSAHAAFTKTMDEFGGNALSLEALEALAKG